MIAQLLPDRALSAPAPVPATDILHHMSASRLSTWQTCRLKFYFKYVLRLEKPTSPSLYLGQQVHAVLKQWNWSRWNREALNESGIHDIYVANWDQDQLGIEIDWGDEDEAALKEKGWQLLQAYFAESPIPPDEKPQGVEVNVECGLEVHGLPPLVGIIDLVRGNGRIVDFKTTARTPDAGQVRHQHETQLCCYALLYREATGREESGFELHHLVKTKEPKVIITPLDPMTPTQEQRLLRVMEDYVEGVQAERWIPSPGQHCSWCDFYVECRKWR